MSPWDLRNFTKCKPYSWNLLLVIYPLSVAVSFMFPEAFNCHVSWTCCPLWIINCGTDWPAAFTDVRTVDVFPCSLLTCWNVLIFLQPSTFTSFRMFCMPVSSPDHIWHGESIPNLFLTSWMRLNQLDMTISLAPIALAIERFFAVLSVICGWHFRNPLSQSCPAIFVVSLNPGIPFTCANWKANWHTRLIVKGNPEIWNCVIVWARSSSSAKNRTKAEIY